MYFIEWYQTVDRKARQQIISTLGEKNLVILEKESLRYVWQQNSYAVKKNLLSFNRYS